MVMSERHPRNGIDSAYGHQLRHAYVRPNPRKGASRRHPPRGKPSLLGAIGHFLFG